MSRLPGGWKMVRLGEVADTALGKMLDAARPKGDLRVPYLRNLNVQWGRVDLSDVLEVPLSEEEHQRFSLQKGDLLVCEGGEIGRAAIWRGGAKHMTYQKALHRVRSRGDLDLYYLRYLLEHYANTGVLAARATGSTIQHFTQRQLRELPIPLPQVAVQARIVQVLEEHFSRLDAARTCTVTGAARLDRWQRAALWEATHPADSSTVRLDDIAEVRLGRQRSPGNHFGDRMRPYLRAANVHWNRLRLQDVKEMNFASAEEDTYRLVAGDVLVVEASGSAAEVGKSAVYAGAPDNVCFQNTLLRVRCHSANSAFIQKYLLAEALAGRLIDESRGVGIYHIGRAKLSSLRVALPNAEEQGHRADKAEMILESSTRLHFSIDSAQRRFTALRNALLEAAFTGRLTSRSKDGESVAIL